MDLCVEREWHNERRDKKGAETERARPHWRTIQSQTGQGACLTYLRNAGVPVAAFTRGGRFAARVLTDTLPTMKNECRRWPHVYGENGATCMRCCADDETTPHWRFYCVGNAASDAREVRAQLKRDLNEILEKLGDVGWALVSGKPLESPGHVSGKTVGVGTRGRGEQT